MRRNRVLARNFVNITGTFNSSNAEMSRMTKGLSSQRPVDKNKSEVKIFGLLDMVLEELLGGCLNTFLKTPFCISLKESSLLLVNFTFIYKINDWFKICFDGLLQKIEHPTNTHKFIKNTYISFFYFVFKLRNK